MRPAIITIITLAIILSGCSNDVQVGVEVQDPTHHCGELQMHCQRLSSTGITCYPTEGTTKGYKRCYAGWVELPPQPEPEEEPEQTRRSIIEYTCTSDACTEMTR